MQEPSSPNSVTPSAVIRAVQTAHHNGLPVVLVTGVFDLLHQEHKTFLEKAKALGYLVVAIESDARVKQIKGPDRPVNTAQKRIQNLQATGIPKQVFILPDAFSEQAVRKQFLDELQPNILAVSSHSPHLDKKKMMMEAIGGRLEVVHQHNPNISTTQLLAKMKEDDADPVG